MDAIQKLENWIESEKANYQRNKHRMTYEEIGKEVDRQLFLLEIQTQIKRCKEEETQEYLDEAFPRTPFEDVEKKEREEFMDDNSTQTFCEEVKQNAKENTVTGL